MKALTYLKNKYKEGYEQHFKSGTWKHELLRMCTVFLGFYTLEILTDLEKKSLLFRLSIPILACIFWYATKKDSLEKDEIATFVLTLVWFLIVLFVSTYILYK